MASRQHMAIWHRRAAAIAFAAFCGASLGAGCAIAQAQQQPRSAAATGESASLAAGSGYLTAFPENDVYRVQVIGDALADGLLGGLAETFGSEQRLALPRRARPLAGLARPEFEDEVKADEANREAMNVAIVMFGARDAKDGGAVRLPGGKRLAAGSDEWRAEYGRRVDRVIRSLKTRNAAVYWIGLPVMRRSDDSDAAQELNEIIRERAFLNGIRFIDIFSEFQDEGGGFNQFGPDLEGKLQKMREGDGVQFTPAGNRKISHYLERELRRDLALARTERGVQLAGGDAEQKQIAATRAAASTTTQPGWKGSARGDVLAGSTAASSGAGPGGPTAAAPGKGDQRANTTQVSFKSADGGKDGVVTVDIVRPALTGTVIALVTRRETAERASQFGETINDDRSGAILVSSIASAVESAPAPGSGVRQPAKASNSALYRVLVKGEHLAARTGRADDFSWPRAEPPVVEPIAAPAQPKAASAPVPAKAALPSAKSKSRQ